MANITVSVTDANNITVQLTPVAAQNITIDRGVAGNGISSIVPVTISTLQYLRIYYTNGTQADVGPLTSTAYFGETPITIVGNTISLSTVPINKGGTNAITAAAAIQNLLPSYTGNGSKRLGLNSGATALEWVADGGGTVTSVDVSGGTTGLTTSGSPITSSGTITLAGTLATTNGGTGLTAFTANGVVYASSTSALNTGSALTYNGVTLVNSTNSNAGNYIVNRNVSTGTVATAYVISDATAAFTGYTAMGSRSSGYTTSGMLEASSGGLFSVGLSNGLNIMTLDGYPVKFGVSNVEKMRLNSSGQRMLGITTPYGIDTVSTTVDNGVAVATNISAFSGAISVIHNQDNPGTGNKNGLFFAHAGAPGLLSGIASTKLSGTWQTTLDFYVNNITGVNTGDIQLAARIDSSGNLVVGATATRGTYKLDIRSDTSIALGSNATYYGTIGYSAGTGLMSLAAESGGGINFLSGATERARIDSSGNLQLQKNMSVGGATPTTSGTGITFPATQSASSDANTLDDYEEGTWTPAWVAGTGTLGSITYENRQGTYTKVGRMVTVQGGFYNSAFAAGTGSGNLQISGLPFTNGSATVGTGSISDVRLWSVNNPCAMQVGVSASSILLYYKTTANGGINNLQVSDATNGAATNLVYFTITYQV